MSLLYVGRQVSLEKLQSADRQNLCKNKKKVITGYTLDKNNCFEMKRVTTMI